MSACCRRVHFDILFISHRPPPPSPKKHFLGLTQQQSSMLLTQFRPLVLLIPMVSNRLPSSTILNHFLCQSDVFHNPSTCSHQPEHRCHEAVIWCLAGSSVPVGEHVVLTFL